MIGGLSMGIQAAWIDDNKLAIEMTFSGDWDWNEFYACSGLIATMFSNVEYPIDVIIDLRNSKKVQADFFVHLHLTDLYRKNAGKIIIVQSNTDQFSLFNQFRNKTTDAKVCREVLYAGTMKEAYSIAERMYCARQKALKAGPNRFLSLLIS